jgi:molybdate transport system ATP-binding protein
LKSPISPVPPDGRLLIECQDLTLHLGGRRLFPHTHWQIREHERWAIIGPNGSGKTLLARALRGDLPAAAGEIIYHFAAGTEAVSPERAIGQVSFETQREALGAADSFHQARWHAAATDGQLSVARYLSRSHIEAISPFEVLPPDHHSKDFGRRQRQVSARLRLASLWDRRLPELSNGEMRRVLLARAWLEARAFLILDDPFAGLDERTRHRLRRALDGLLRLAPPLLLITGREEELPDGITHLLCVEAGRVVAQGLKGDLLRRAWARRQLIRATASRPQTGAALRRLAPAGSRSGPAVIEMRRVTVTGRGTTILRHVDWEVKAGENWALLGPNGSGKTTLLSLVLGDHPQVYANSIRLFGRPLGAGLSLWELRRKIGWVSPELQAHFPGHFGVAEVIGSGHFDTLGLYRRLTVRQQQSVRLWLRRLGIGALADRRFSAVSMGEQRLALLARTLVKRPRLLILDETCQGLDVTQRHRILARKSHSAGWFVQGSRWGRFPGSSKTALFA